MPDLARTQLTLPGFKATPTGLVPSKTLSLVQWEEAGDVLGHIEGRLMWYVGDWLIAGEGKGYLERGKLDEACERFRIAYKTAANAASTCRALKQSSRRRELSYGHHAEVANHDDAEELLDWCEKTDPPQSVQELRAEKRRRSKEAARIPPPKGKYRVIYADPPWQYGDERGGLVGYTAAQDHYETMPLDDICDLPIEDLAHENAVLFLWSPAPLLPEAYEVVDAWGFEYKAEFVWDKVKHNVGHYISVRHELLLICTRGSCTPDASKLPNSVQRIERGKHSEKPGKFYELIEGMYTSGPYIELFARRARKGWKAWGNQLQTS